MEGLDQSENISARLTGKLVAPFTGDMSYNISSDNGYKLYVNGRLVEEAKAGQGGGRGGFGGFGGGFGGFGGRGGMQQMKSFKVVKGQTYDIKRTSENGRWINLYGEVRKNGKIRDASRDG